MQHIYLTFSFPAPPLYHLRILRIKCYNARKSRCKATREIAKVGERASEREGCAINEAGNEIKGARRASPRWRREESTGSLVETRQGLMPLNVVRGELGR